MITKLRYNDERAFAFPIGSGPLRPAVEALLEFCAERDYPLLLRGVTEKHRSELDTEFPGRFSYCLEENLSDYIYPAERLATYAGKAMHGKKNHCNRFEAENDWDFVPITRELIPGCLDMLVVWNEENAARLDPSVVFEHDAVVRAFAAFERLGLEGGALRVQGKIVGFTLGEMCSADTFDVHFEKADAGINGAYPMICRELTRMLLARHPGLVYINREDDMGLEPLRRSKQSYKPEYLLKKYTARWIDDDDT